MCWDVRRNVRVWGSVGKGVENCVGDVWKCWERCGKLGTVLGSGGRSGEVRGKHWGRCVKMCWGGGGKGRGVGKCVGGARGEM